MSKLGVVVGNCGLYDESKWKTKEPTKTNNYINKITYTKSIEHIEEKNNKWQA